MDIVYTGKCGYKIQEQKEVPEWYTGTFGALRTITHIEIRNIIYVHYIGARHTWLFFPHPYVPHFGDHRPPVYRSQLDPRKECESYGNARFRERK
jgi:hypothetical protein